MNFFNDTQKRKKIIIGASTLLVLVAIFITCAVYLSDYYRADMIAIQSFLPQDTQWEEKSDGIIVFETEESTKGFIFYPGGKVEYTAYIPLMHTLSEQGILCVLIEMPFNLAVLDINAADGIQEQYPQIEDWYIGGHSLGGSMAASYLSDNLTDFEGLILLGSYSTTDFSNSNLNVLSIYGSEDKVMNQEKYDKNKSNLPNNFTEIIIEGGCHAYFGMYGAQDGDGTPSISNEEQINITANAIIKLVK